MSEADGVYHDLFSNNADIVQQFKMSAEQAAVLDSAEVIYAAYSYESYSGSAFVLFRKGGKLFEANGGHCSCHGLEDQWDPEETTVAALKKSTYGWRKEVVEKLFPLSADSYKLNGKLRKNVKV